MRVGCSLVELEGVRGLFEGVMGRRLFVRVTLLLEVKGFDEDGDPSGSCTSIIELIVESSLLLEVVFLPVLTLLIILN